ncbi:ubiquitin-activating enzyme E1 [Plasmodium gonderi]|uniref:Ubiquitin-activating enzyme E1 n=1 Tax=Plasmodium gonderi TaxID=77519 RepID=A0A1Y1JHT7_PLAGO|nr:ubiquitin-activating enzyme E1 [Plasmodium gonderi]GAW82071.1 ubiquitin-activating enzyme E1 [Plasmodium gonderi]
MEEEEKFTRQISLWGTVHQEILMDSSVCILGSSLIVMEVARGILLSGISNITIVDNERVCVEDVKYYIFCKENEIINEYKCVVLKENLMSMNKNANIVCLIENPINYVYEIISKNYMYDVIICNLCIRNNLFVQKICMNNCFKIITCYSNGNLGYVHASVRSHLYTGSYSMKKREENNFWIYFHISLSLYDELKEYIHKLDFCSFCPYKEKDKILFLLKCYHDFFQQGKTKVDSNQCLTFIMEKLKLENFSLPHPDQSTTCSMENLRNITQRIRNLLLMNQKECFNKNHIFLFLIVLKSFIKNEKTFPLVHDLKLECSSAGSLDLGSNRNDAYFVNEILTNRKMKDVKKVMHLIDRKKGKYKFSKPFNMSHFVHFFFNFFFIEKVEYDIHKGCKGLRDNFLLFSYLYGLELKNVQKNNLNMFTQGSSSPICNPNCVKENSMKNSSAIPSGGASSDGYMIIRRKKFGKLLLCGSKAGLLHFYQSIEDMKIRKKLNKHVKLCSSSIEENITRKLRYDNMKSLHRLCLYIDMHMSFLLKKVQNLDDSFLHLFRFTCGYNECVCMTIAGLVTQESLKICSLYLKPHLNYFFFKL